MMKYKQVNVVHPEDVGVPRKLMSDIPQEANSSNTFSKSKLPIIVFVLIILGLILWLVPYPERVELVMHGGEVDRQGNELVSGDIVLKGWRYHYLFQEDRFKATYLELPGFEIYDVWNNEANIIYHMKPLPEDLRQIHIVVWTKPAYEDSDSIYIFTTDDYDFLTFLVPNTKQLFVGSTEQVTDYVQILNKCMLLYD